MAYTSTFVSLVSPLLDPVCMSLRRGTIITGRPFIESTITRYVNRVARWRRRRPHLATRWGTSCHHRTTRWGTSRTHRTTRWGRWGTSRTHLATRWDTISNFDSQRQCHKFLIHPETTCRMSLNTAQTQDTSSEVETVRMNTHDIEGTRTTSACATTMGTSIHLIPKLPYLCEEERSVVMGASYTGYQ